MRMAFLVLLLGACSDRVAWEDETQRTHGPLDEALRTTAWEVLSQPDRMELLSLSHHSVENREYSELVTDGVFHGYPVLGRAVIDDRDEQRLLVRSFYESARDARGEMLCFMPHHAIHAERGDHTIDLVICFHCWLFQLYDGSGVVYPEAGLSNFGEMSFRRAVATRGLEIEYDPY
jgi:hypothetical protein